MLMWLCLVVFLYFVYKIGIVPIFYWKKRGFSHRTPLPILGNLAPLVLRKLSFYDWQEQVYKNFSNERYNGSFEMTTPTIVIRDLELIKQICVKHFDHFTDHRSVGNEHDALFFRNLLSLKGNEWRQMRAFLSPAFTSSKMRGMHGLMTDCARRVTNYFVELDEKLVDVDLKDLFTRYANDVIATCAFGLECDSLKDKENEFYLTGKDATNFTGLRAIKMMLAFFSPSLTKVLGFKIFPKRVSDFFINLIADTIAYREANNVIRPDIIHLLLEARKGKLKHEQSQEENDQGFAIIEESNIGKQDSRLDTNLSDLDIAAHCFIFFFGGFETASTLLCFTVSELAINPDIQEKLYEEIDQVMTQSHGTPSYDVLMKMKYLDMIISESLRLWPPAPGFDRICTNNFTIEPVRDTEVPVTIEVGELISVPTLGIHRDPKYFPNPRRFDPERFSDGNKLNIIPYSYLPFGVGPRACIGSRFALLEAKILLVHLLYKFEAVVIEKSVVPIVLTKKSNQMIPDGGFWVGLKRRGTK